jgi:hypothetical protein
VGSLVTGLDATRSALPFVYEPLGSDGVARIRWAPGTILTEDLARASLVELSALTGGKKVPVLADIRKLKSMTREARKHYAVATMAVTAIALLASSPATQMIANFFLGLNRPNVPTQMFTDEEKALTWLRRHVV